MICNKKKEQERISTAQRRRRRRKGRSRRRGSAKERNAAKREKVEALPAAAAVGVQSFRLGECFATAQPTATAAAAPPKAHPRSAPPTAKHPTPNPQVHPNDLKKGKTRTEKAKYRSLVLPFFGRCITVFAFEVDELDVSRSEGCRIVPPMNDNVIIRENRKKVGSC